MRVPPAAQVYNGTYPDYNYTPFNETVPDGQYGAGAACIIFPTMLTRRRHCCIIFPTHAALAVASTLAAAKPSAACQALVARILLPASMPAQTVTAPDTCRMQTRSIYTRSSTCAACFSPASLVSSAKARATSPTLTWYQ